MSSRVLENFIIKLKKDTEASLTKAEKAKAAKYGGSWNGNSRLLGSIKTMVKGQSVQMSMNNYWHFVDGGRKPGSVSQTGQASIRDWVKRKGLNPSKIIDEMKAKSAIKNGLIPSKKKTPFDKAVKQFGYIATRKVKLKGFEGNDFYSSVINDGRLDKLKKDIGAEMKLELLKAFKEDNVSNPGK